MRANMMRSFIAQISRGERSFRSRRDLSSIPRRSESKAVGLERRTAKSETPVNGPMDVTMNWLLHGYMFYCGVHSFKLVRNHIKYDIGSRRKADKAKAAGNEGTAKK